MFRTDRPGDDGDDDDEDDEDDEDDNDISQGTLQFDVSLDGNHTDEVAGDASSLDLSPTSLPFQPTKMQNDDDHDRRKKMINAGQQHHVHLPTHVPDSYITSHDVATVKEAKHVASGNSKHAKSQLKSTRPNETNTSSNDSCCCTSTSTSKRNRRLRHLLLLLLPSGIGQQGPTIERCGSKRNSQAC